MTSSKTLKKIITIGAAALIAIAGSLTASAPATAAEVTNVSQGGGSGLQAGMTSVSLGVGTCNSYSGTVNLNDFALTLSSGSQTISSINLMGYIVVNFSSALTSGQTVTITYTKNVSRILTCNNGDTVGSFNFTGVVSGGQMAGGTVVSNPVIAYANGVLTSTAAVWNNASVNKRSYWLVCSSSHAAMNGDLNSNVSRPSDCGPISATALSGQAPTWINSTPYTIPASVNKWVSCNVNVCTTSIVSTTGAFYTWYEFDNGVWTQAATIGADGSSSSPSVAAAPALTPEQARNQIKPLPVIVQPLVAALPALSKPLVDAGGKVDLKSGDFSGLVSAVIAGKALDINVSSTGSLSINVPNGKAGTTADLLLNFKSGSVILQDAIKYVAPVVVAEVPVRAVSIKAGAKKLSATAADEIRHAAFANLKNNSIQCVGFAASDSTAAKAAAQLTAIQACDLAVKSNSDLVNSEVVVVVDKIKAATQGVGIKVYKQ